MNDARSSSGGATTAAATSSSLTLLSGIGRLRFEVELKIGETTIVSWKKLMKDDNKAAKKEDVVVIDGLVAHVFGKIKGLVVEYRAKLKKSNERSLALIKSAMNIVVAVGLLQLAPKKVTPRVTGAFGFTMSLISCYQLLPSPPKSKAP